MVNVFNDYKSETLQGLPMGFHLSISLYNDWVDAHFLCTYFNY